MDKSSLNYEIANQRGFIPETVPGYVSHQKICRCVFVGNRSDIKGELQSCHKMVFGGKIQRASKYFYSVFPTCCRLKRTGNAKLQQKDLATNRKHSH